MRNDLNDTVLDSDGEMDLALQHYDSGRLPQAEEICRRIIRIHPGHAKALNLLGIISFQCGRRNEGFTLLLKAVELQPDFAAAHSNLGNVYKEQGLLSEAAACYRRALAINPDLAMPHNNLGNVYKEQGKLHEAVICYRNALAIKPDFYMVHNNLGNLFKAQGNLDGAVASYQKTLSFNPDYSEAHYNIGLIFLDQGKLEESVASFRKALTANPAYAEAYNGLGNALVLQGKVEEAAESYRSALAANPGYAGAHSNLLFCLNYDPAVSVEQLFEEHLAWDVRHGWQIKGKIKPCSNIPSPNRPLRIGYVSADFGHHPVGCFLAPVLPAHDRHNFKVFCYSARVKEDDLTIHLRTNSDVWRAIHAVDDDDLVEIIRGDAIDILVDLSGHTAGNRLTMFAHKPAPVQMTWAGYVGTTGLSTIDYLISDGRESPEGAEQFYTEEVIRLPDCYVCYAPRAYAPPVGPLPALAKGYITFGCFNNLAKVTPQVIALWSLLLKELPDAHLVLKTRALSDDATRERYMSLFASHGIGEGRIELFGPSPHPELLGCYNTVDIALDPFPYSGGLTSLEALWMGVPVITLEGERFCSRHSSSHLTAAGLPELVTSDPERYIETAVALARDKERLAAIRSGLRRRIAASPLCDGSRLTRNLEAAYREAWRRWCRETGSHGPT